ncbi:hypothetical protein DAETH_43560 (plasmid) [Deinococcus aetherius]|uniref:DUF11 domain-containing protein n=1 Tax=Deinococcus aetherius TaxID=200252 RepID=A0ABN6RM53_9DEIO|nr:hypothetical protein [Deinococcus aetherius]BDP44387.1 hypothetical protein DAETH_43560 [Deinococcus aetherius]
MKKLLVTALLAAASGALAVGAPAGSTIQNIGVFEFTDVGGTTTSTPTTPVNITVTQQYDPNVSPDGSVAAPGQTQTALPGQTATLTYNVTNSGNGTDTLNLSVTDAQTGAPLGATIYLDNPLTGTVGSYDPGDTVVTSLQNMTADETRRVFVVYTVPSNAAGNQQTYVNLTATSAGNPAKTDSNNVGLITATSILSFTLDGDNTVSVTPTGTVTATHTLTNTGNATLDASTLVATTTLTDPNAASGGVSYTVTNSATGASVSNASLQTALQNAGNLPAGETYTIVVTYTGAAGATNGQSFTNQLTVYSNAADSTGFDNRVEQGQSVSDTDTVNVNRGVASVSKTVDNCGTDASCQTAPVLNSTTAKPGEYLRYTVTVTNTGGSALRFPTLRDYVPANTTFKSVTGSSTQAGNVLFSNNRTNWYLGAPNTLATSTTSASGPFVYVGLDSSGDSTVDAGDSLAPGQTLRLVITVQVRNN